MAVGLIPGARPTPGAAGARGRPGPAYAVRLARDGRDLLAAQRLRYQVFVQELGAAGPLVDHARQLERDEFDAHVDHLLLIDEAAEREGRAHVVGVYRLLPPERLAATGGYYCAQEFDLAPLLATGRRLLELGRSCVHPDHRGGSALYHLWQGLAEYIRAERIEVMFGAASFHGTDPAALAQPLSWLYHYHLAPPALRPHPIGPTATAIDRMAPADLDRTAAMAAMPALIRAYLRLGGFVSDGAYVDRAFNTVDLCLVMDTERMSEKHVLFYARRAGAMA